MSRGRIIMLLVLGAAVATMLILAIHSGQAMGQGYGAVSSGGTTATGTGGANTGAEVIMFAGIGAALLGTGFFLTRKSKA